MTIRKSATLAAAVFAGLALQLFADGAPPAAPASTPAAADQSVIPAESCTKPTPLPDDFTNNDVKAYNHSLVSYKSCVEAYVAQRKEAIDKYSALARQYAQLAKSNSDAAQKAIEEFNGVNDQVQKLNAAHGVDNSGN